MSRARVRSKTRLLKLRVLCLLGIGLGGCAAETSDAPRHPSGVALCANAGRGAGPRGGETVIADDPEPPCRVVIDTAVVRRYPATAMDSLDLDQVRAVDRHGNIYVQGYQPGVVTVLSPTGARIARFGRRGPGPGELSAGYLGVDVSDNDSIYIHDNARRISVFDSRYDFVRSFPMGDIQSGSGMRCVFADGALASSAAVHGGARPATLRFFTPDGVIRHEAGQPAGEGPARATPNRRIACGTRGTIWALPSPLEPSYRLERWSAQGELLHAGLRDAGWFEAGPPLSRTAALTARPPSEVRQVVELFPGLLLTLVVTGDSRWEPVSRDEWDARMADLLDVHIELLDVVAGRLLAAMTLDDPHAIPNAWIQANGSSYEFVTDESGAVTLLSYTYHVGER